MSSQTGQVQLCEVLQDQLSQIGIKVNLEVLENISDGRSRVCFKTIKVTKQGYKQDRQQRENKELSSHIWWQNGGCFSA